MTEMVPISKTIVKEILKREGITQLQLADMVDVNKDYLNRSLRTGKISKRILNSIGQTLNYCPEYLSGTFTPEITGDDPISNALHRELISYNTKFNIQAQSAEDHFIQGLLLIFGFDRKYYSSLAEKEKALLKKKLHETIYDFDFHRSIIY